MNKLSLILCFFYPLLSFAQVTENFSDGNFSQSPSWYSTGSNFTVNANMQLQSAAASSSVSFISTPSEAFDNASWECWIKINYNPSAYNYAQFYIACDKMDISNGCNGYYVQVGGANDEVSLYLQEGTKKTKIIDGIDKRTDRNVVEIRIKVTRNSAGDFVLESKLADESNFRTEGSTGNVNVKSSKYIGLLYANTSATGSAYYFDDIVVSGNKVADNTPPSWLSVRITAPSTMQLVFSEEMDVTGAEFFVDQGQGLAQSKSLSADKTSIQLQFANVFEKQRVYTLTANGLKDMAGNELQLTERKTGVLEKPNIGEVVINELMFEQPLASSEYIEIYNLSDKVLDVSGLIISTRKTDGTINSGTQFPEQTILFPHDYLALGENAELIRTYHACPANSNILNVNWNSLNNEGACLVLANEAKDSVYDELTYSYKWHHVLVKNPKGVALERINPYGRTQDANNWHSGASETNYGTPGYQNAQFRTVEISNGKDKWAWVDPEAFSPDNDGIDDLCMLHYKSPGAGYVANILILNSVGEKMTQLANNQLLATEGYVSWDGKCANGKNAQAGIYIVYFEIFNPTNGQKHQLKIPIVVTAR